MITTMKMSLVIAGVLVISFPSMAHAYIDPGVGSMIIQLVLAAGMGLVYWFRKKILSFIVHLKTFFWRRK